MAVLPPPDEDGAPILALVVDRWEDRTTADSPDVRPVGDLPDEIGKTAARERCPSGIKRLEQVAHYSQKDFLTIHGVGLKAIRILSGALAPKGLGFTSGEPMVESTHPSSSHEHKSAEAVILDHVAGELGVDDLAPARLELDGVAVELDGWSPSAPAAVEVYARVSLPKGGAVKKPMDDAMRLLLVQRHHPESRLVLAFATDEVADCFRTGRGWRAAALSAAGIGVMSAGLEGDLLKSLLAATKRQFR